jgi:hypothetical protein
MSNAAITDGIGFAAAALVLATFCMRGMRTLRLVAIASNVAFIAYGYLGHLAPVLWLHALLLPINICRLMQLRGEHLRISSQSRGNSERAPWPGLRPGLGPGAEQRMRQDAVRAAGARRVTPAEMTMLALTLAARSLMID